MIITGYTNARIISRLIEECKARNYGCGDCKDWAHCSLMKFDLDRQIDDTVIKEYEVDQFGRRTLVGTRMGSHDGEIY